MLIPPGHCSLPNVTQLASVHLGPIYSGAGQTVLIALQIILHQYLPRLLLMSTRLHSHLTTTHSPPDRNVLNLSSRSYRNPTGTQALLLLWPRSQQASLLDEPSISPRPETADPLQSRGTEDRMA